MVVAAARFLVLTIVLSWMGTAAAAQSNGTGAVVAQPATGQVPADDGAKNDVRPLPDIPTLMREVESNQRAEETREKDYLYQLVVTAQELDGHRSPKKTETRQYDVFWLEGVEIYRMTSKDGQALSPKEQKKESERIDKEVAKAKERRAKADAEGEETDSHGNEEITVSRLLELGRFTNPRRIMLNGWDTIEVDYAGDPKAKTQNRAETVIRDLVGTVWVDEQDHVLVKAEGHFVNSFKVGAGLVMNIQKGTSFGMEQKKVNNEVWLPALFEGHGEARAFLIFHMSGNMLGVASDYRKFKASATILPGMGMVPK